jgi:glycosyltransferase involved in cell wall biosynthesis
LKHVLIIAQYFPPDVGGSSTRAYNVVMGLKDQGCIVTVVTAFPHYPDGKIPKEYRRKLFCREIFDGTSIIRTWVPPVSHYTIGKRLFVHASFIVSSLLGLFIVRKTDVIFAMNPSLFSFFPALVYKLFFKAKIIRNVDDLWPEVWYDLGIVKSRFLKRLLNWIAQISYDIPVAITPVSHAYVSLLTRNYKLTKEKIFVIEHGVDMTKFYFDPNKSIKINDPKKLQKDSPVITKVVYSGALSIGYDFEPVIKAAKILENEPVNFILRGMGTTVGDIENIKNLIEKEKTRNIEVRTDKLSPDDLAKFLHEADIFVLPMNFVGFDIGLPTKLLEYQALGKPVICISNGESADYVSRTKSGLVCRSKDPQKIADLIRKLVYDENLSRELGTNGCYYVLRNLTLNRIGQRFMNVINTRCS